MADKLATLSQLKNALARVRARIEQMELTPAPAGNLLKQEAIPSGTDLDDYIADGFAVYKTLSNGIAQTILHKPNEVNSSFALIVARASSGDSYAQILLHYSGNRIYQRRKVAGTWDPWAALGNASVRSSTVDPGAGSALTSGEVLVVYE